MNFQTFSYRDQLTEIRLVKAPEIIKRLGKMQSRFSCKNILIRESKGSSSVSMLALVDILSRSSLVSSQQSVTMLRRFLQETSENSRLLSSTSSSGTISIFPRLPSCRLWWPLIFGINNPGFVNYRNGVVSAVSTDNNRSTATFCLLKIMKSRSRTKYK